MALHSIYPDNRYYDYAYSWADGFKWGMRRDDSTTRNADNYCAAQVYIDLYRLTPRPEMLTKTKATMNMLVNTPQVDDWTWIDAIQMGMPILAKLSATTGDPRYAESLRDVFLDPQHPRRRSLQQERWPVVARRRLCAPYKEPNGKDCYWSRGNGWVVAALVRVLDEIPADDPTAKSMRKTFRTCVPRL